MISGYTISRDSISNDYCIEESIRSMLPFCDEVVVADAMSEDGTRELIERLSLETYGRVRVVDYVREDVFGDALFISKWANFARSKIRQKYGFYLEADEVVDEGAGDRIKQAAYYGRALRFKRLNFWRDHRHLAPHGTVCSDSVIRSGPSEMWMPMDCPGLHPRDSEYLPIQETSGVNIFHYGFLRTESGFIRKSRFLQPAMTGTFDGRIDEAERTGEKWVDVCRFPEGKSLIPFGGSHPSFGKQWLRDRGHAVD